MSQEKKDIGRITLTSGQTVQLPPQDVAEQLYERKEVARALLHMCFRGASEVVQMAASGQLLMLYVNELVVRGTAEQRRAAIVALSALVYPETAETARPGSYRPIVR